jgi:hypothetical protein
MSIVQKLTEGIINRDLSKDGTALISKWEKTGLLEGLESDHLRNGMAALLENQAKELLRESSSMAAGDVEGFAAVAFPLVRRVFGNLIANDLVSVQPMSLPSGLIFFLDFTVSAEVGANRQLAQRLGYPAGSSLFGGGRVGAGITRGVSLSGSDSERGPYALNNGYSSPTGSNFTATPPGAGCFTLVQSGTSGIDDNVRAPDGVQTLGTLTGFDMDLISGSTTVAVFEVPIISVGADGAATGIQNANGQQDINMDDLTAIQIQTGPADRFGVWVAAAVDAPTASLCRRLWRFSSASAGGPINDRNSPNLLMVAADYPGLNTPGAIRNAVLTLRSHFTYPQTDEFANVATSLGAVVGQPEWGLEDSPFIPEIDILIDSVAVTAVTKKLKAKWTPELGQDLNAYHNLDAEVELTQILSEQIALEIDQEILNDLVKGATAGLRYWSRAPGLFLNRETGAPLGVAAAFTGNVSEWYETLVETVNDVSAQIHRKTLRGGANFIVCGPEVANVLEFTAGFRANVAVDSDRGTAGTVKVGNLSKKWDIYVDPYFLRNVLLVGRRGGSFLESGYVYAPYVPLQTTPTIFGVEDFVPRKGVMTRYAKQMVRPDMYGIVVVADMEA